MNLCMGGVKPAWPGGRDMGGWLAYLLVEGTICILTFYYKGYTLSGQVIIRSEIIIIWPFRVCVCVCVCVCVLMVKLTRKFMSNTFISNFFSNIISLEPPKQLFQLGTLLSSILMITDFLCFCV
uniref:Uncharacterized protein n=1 Tax=Pipistrellus kuhlii TaxID=59472 RepID=A0A7J8B2M2_PIPKU|nr:hypothetical protein mPipKuh1_007799 [Pipistrellus kuhlii]